MKGILVLLFLCFSQILWSQQDREWKLGDIPIRDPYILSVEEQETYYLYSATRGEFKGPNGRQGICVYKSSDLSSWEGPFIVFENPEGFWADPDHGIWAPEVHRYNDKYYLFATFTNPEDTIDIRLDGIPVMMRGTQILIANSPMGPFQPFNLKKPTTPEDWSALDGTLWLENENPFMVFCHEWVQINEGTFEYVEMNKDLSEFTSKPKKMFKVNEAGWVERMDILGKKYKGQLIPGFVSDGPFIYRLPSGKIICLTSSFGEKGYSLSYAIAESGKLAGPWFHPEKPLLTGGHGHGMLFKTFDGKLMLICHYPNTSPSKAVIYEVEELNSGITIVGKYK
ncbi:glycoside hydrolase family 43 protein [Draconibacterium orientale]|uniref:glycoside hydrolase family 43 protein n=1 Tax=Draconibacterium orientale TaxID=1168034 RepID=UPI002ABDF8F3|nr:glycoside hydrolase family 43 protein [Draconibacterium orientale]